MKKITKTELDFYNFCAKKHCKCTWRTHFTFSFQNLKRKLFTKKFVSFYLFSVQKQAIKCQLYTGVFYHRGQFPPQRPWWCCQKQFRSGCRHRPTWQVSHFQGVFLLHSIPTASPCLLITTSTSHPPSPWTQKRKKISLLSFHSTYIVYSTTYICWMHFIVSNFR